MGVIAIIAIIYIVVKLIAEACEKELPASYHGNVELEHQDYEKVQRGQMTMKQFLKNMDNGKYYAPPEKKD